MTDEANRTHITQVGTVFVPVADQDRALKFYLDKLGFEKRVDFRYGEDSRWIEVAPPGAANTIALVSPGEGKAVGGNQTYCAFATEDIEADHATLRARGVEVDAGIARKGKRRAGLRVSVMSENRVTKQTNDSKLVQALGKFYKSGTSLSLVGLDYRIPVLQKLFNDHIAVTNKAEQAHVDLNAAVTAQAESEAAIKPIRRALANVVKAKFGESSATILEFGFKPKKVTEKTAAVKADAAEKATATKAAGGKKAKKKADAAAAALAAANAATTIAPQAITSSLPPVAQVATVAPVASTTPASVVAAVAKGVTGS